jgi:hypothetical protein
MGKPWFGVKRYGVGAGLPCSWQGWVVLAAFLVVVFGVGLADIPSGRRVALVLGATLAFGVVARLKSDRPWKWRWGGE